MIVFHYHRRMEEDILKDIIVFHLRHTLVVDLDIWERIDELLGLTMC